ncbi:hypothetical protein NEMBOFW57_004538 [Staphylotrichum longicolle]|uniref:Pathway-specific nitrogen regulator n=1 Tax=Staphylotrichum longicolle TaxID=669026 RepID=A0AAD4I5Q1_9PEZI|nr:hypothetical protein NEMBOFW57_004538 [Staphylotrichum longicolle]
MSPSPEEVQEPPVLDVAEDPATQNTTEDLRQPAEDCVAEPADATPESQDATPTTSDTATEQPETELAQDQPQAEQQDEAANVPVDEPPTPEVEDTTQVAAEVVAGEEEVAEDATVPEPSTESESVAEPETFPEDASMTEAAEPASNPEPETEAAPDSALDNREVDEPVPEPEEHEPLAQQEAAEHEETAAAPESTENITGVESQEASESAAEQPDVSQDVQPDEPSREDNQQSPSEDVDAPRPQDVDCAVEDDASHPRSPMVDRKTSLRTEALIQAAARAIVTKIERRNSGQPVEHEEEDFDNSLLSTGSQDTYVLGDDAQSTYSDHQPPNRRQSDIRHIPSRSLSSDSAGESSSPHEPDDDVFSVRSARSSLCSLDDATDLHDNKTPQAKESLSRRDSTRPTPLSSLHDPLQDPHALPHPVRDPRHADGLATPSVFNGSSPRSSPSKRTTGSGLPQSISRIASPTPSSMSMSNYQYSPKGRTPPRFKPRKDPAPLVLLHVTLLPLRWPWADVLQALDALPASSGWEPSSSEPLKALRDAWRALQDRVGDTVLERGVLVPHPQNDYEVLEERLLEALELPVRRRARILECGHYLGPANVEAEEADAEDEDGEGEEEGTAGGKRHWCGTCRGEIRYEDLGAGKVFRVKVYASNGLMRAGAWEACWKEMERVDVEVEPVVDVAVQGELEKLGVMQLEMEERRRVEAEMERAAELEAEMKRELLRADTPGLHLAEAEMDAQRAFMSSPAPSAMQLAAASTSLVRASTPVPAPQQTEPIDTSEERRRRDEERMREIYGDAPPAPPPAPAPAQLPAPPAPVESQQQQYQQHSQALTTTTPPPMPLLTDGSAMHHRHPHQPHHPDDYIPRHTHDDGGYPPHRERHEPPNARRRLVLDENSGFVELLMEAFKVLLRDPKNVAIIVLCVFLVVMMKRPGMADQGGLVPVSAGGQGAYRFEVREEVPEVRVGQAPRVTMGEKNGVEVPVVEEVAAVLKSTAGVEEEGLASVLAADSFPEASAASAPEEPLGSQVMEEQAVVETMDPEVVEALEEPLEIETATEVDVVDNNLPADVCAPLGLDYPITLVGEVPTDEDSEAEGELSAEAEVEANVEDETARVVLEHADSVDTDTELLKDADVEAPSTDANESPSIADECSAPSPDDANTGFETDPDSDAEPGGRCSMDLDADSDVEDALPTPSASASASTTSLFIPGPYVTERKTVRVFETATETVRVSVVTQTETVSTVVTAVPQTVEETVYETETVRITVSVPVEEQKKRAKAKETKGCRKWF